jgi:4-hydroxybenzoate polyprenyltransferase
MADTSIDSRPKAQLADYVAIARPDHWIKHVMIVPGIVFAWLLAPADSRIWDGLWQAIVIGFASACLISSANYVINEWLDASFDAKHPKKSSRPAVRTAMDRSIVYAEYILLVAAGLGLASLISHSFLAVSAVFAVAGLVYNVRPFRTKDVPFLDVISESLNNPLRLLLGWFMVAPAVAPPISVIIAYWAGGAFLMAVKRLAEHRYLTSSHGPEQVALYRPSLAGYKDSTLIIAALIYAQLFAFMMAVFLVKYRIEYALLFPPLCVLFALYMRLGYAHDSAAQAPERLFRQPAIMGLAASIVILFLIFTFVDLPQLGALTEPHFLPVER